MLLSGEGDLRASFRIEKFEKRGAVDWLTLLPNEVIPISSACGLDAWQYTGAMELSDKLGQTTALEFRNVHVIQLSTRNVRI